MSVAREVLSHLEDIGATIEPAGDRLLPAAKPQAGKAAEHDAADLRQGRTAEQNDQRRYQGDRSALAVRAERARHAPHRLRHDGDGNELEAVQQARSGRSSQSAGTVGEDNEHKRVMISSFRGGGCAHFMNDHGVQRPCAGTFDQQIDRSQQHADVGAGFVRHAPESITRQFRRMKDQKVVPEQNRHFCGHDCDNHDDDQRDRRESGKEADNDECAAHRFDHTYKRTHEIGIGDADIGETPSPKNLRKGQFLNPFGKKDH